MNIVSRNVSVNMVRRTLNDLPSFPVPADHSIRWYQSGHEDFWVQIQSASDKYSVITPSLFRQEFGDDSKALAERQAFLFDRQDVPVGTATAWFDDEHYGEKYGRIHWVAIVPRSQGRGLSKPLLSVACRRLRDLGHDKAYLVTSTARIPAINLYLSFGFIPEIRSPEDMALWSEMKKHLKESGS